MSLERPDYNQLSTFLKVVDTGSFSSAARLSGKSQPAVSQAIARLENIYGGDLFERRRGAPLQLTPIGAAILPSARLIVYTIDQQMTRAVQTAQSRAGSLSVGVFPGTSAGLLRTAITDFTAAQPAVKFKLVEEVPMELYRLLNERKLDLIIVAFMPEVANKDLIRRLLWEEQLFVVLPADHALTSIETVTWKDVAGLPIILKAWEGEASAYRALLNRVGNRFIDCEQHAVSRGVLFDMIGMGLGVTVTFESCITDRADLAFRRIKDVDSTIAVDAIWPLVDNNPLRHNFVARILPRGS